MTLPPTVKSPVRSPSPTTCNFADGLDVPTAKLPELSIRTCSVKLAPLARV